VAGRIILCRASFLQELKTVDAADGTFLPVIFIALRKGILSGGRGMGVSPMSPASVSPAELS